MTSVTLVMDRCKAIHIHDCLSRQIGELIEHGWTIDRINDIPEYHDIVTVCNELADAYPECELERY